jgi:hypothetical protein
MKNLRVLVNRLASVAGLLLISACGNSSTTASSASTTCASGYTYSSVYGSCLYTGTSTTCASGYVYSSTYGSCLQQTTACEGNYAIYNSACVLYNGTTTTTTTSLYQGSCSAGYIHTADGCLTQGACTTGYGYGYYYGQPWCFPYTAY